MDVRPKIFVITEIFVNNTFVRNTGKMNYNTIEIGIVKNCLGLVKMGILGILPHFQHSDRAS